jgi:outer membrane protein assembly factor BamB
MQDVSMFKVTKGSKEHFAHPVINRGVLYIRHGEFLGAYSISK